jgi:hypothetical protein
VKNYYTISKVYIDFLLLVYNFAILFSFGFLYHNFQLLSNQVTALEKLNSELLLQNNELRQLFRDRAPEVINPAAVTPMTDEYKIFLIKLAVILVGLSLFGACTYLGFYWFKASIVGFFQKGVWGYLSSFLTYNHLDRISYTDKLNNNIVVRFIGKSVDIDIKPFNSETYISLEEFFSKHPELFREVLQSSTDVVNSAIVQSSAVAPTVETLTQFVNRIL